MDEPTNETIAVPSSRVELPQPPDGVTLRSLGSAPTGAYEDASPLMAALWRRITGAEADR